MDPLQHIIKEKIVAIIRGLQPKDVLPVVEALYEGGIRTLEITMNSPNAMHVIETVVKNAGEKMLVGAGTILDGQAAISAISAGARFIISPTVNLEVIEMTKRKAAVSIPGAYTPTEIVQAHKIGADIIKVFPCSIGPQYINDIRGPLPHIPLMPTGGVGLHNVRAFLNAGAVALGIGGALVDAKYKVDAAHLAKLSEKARLFVNATTIEDVCYENKKL